MPTLSISIDYPPLSLPGDEEPGHLHEFDWEATDEEFRELLASQTIVAVENGLDPADLFGHIVRNAPEMIAGAAGNTTTLRGIDVTIVAYCLQFQCNPPGEDRGPAPLLEWMPIYDFRVEMEVGHAGMEVEIKAQARTDIAGTA